MGFSGELWERDCFAFVFAVLLQRRRNKTTLKCFGALETSSYIIYYVYSDYESGAAGRDLRCAESEK